MAVAVGGDSALPQATSSEGLAGVIESIRPMEKLLADMSLVLPPYDMRQAQEVSRVVWYRGYGPAAPECAGCRPLQH